MPSTKRRILKMKRSKKWLAIAATVVVCTATMPVHAEEEVAAPIAEITEPQAENTEASAAPPVAEVIEAPAEQPAVEIPVAEDAIPETVVNPYVPVIPALLSDHLALETYEGLEDPNAKIVLIDISDQYVWAFENGISVLESPMISGKANTKAETSRGVFSIVKKTPGKYLRGPRDKNGNYAWECWVDYWMLFDKKRSIGLHDASWRSAEQYTSETYITNGSRGCVNLPCDFAPLLYDFIEVGTPVIVQD